MQKVINQLFILILMINILNYNAQDWPNLKKYQKENATLKPIKINQKRVVFIGNSITEFWGSHSNYFSLNKEYINRGISGQTTPQMLLRFRQDVIELRPSIVVILAGINDIAQNTGPSTVEMIANNIFSMAELAKVNNIEVLLCSVLPAEKFSWSANIEPTKIVIELNEKIRNYAIKNQITYVNYFDEMKNKSNGMKKELAEDGIHPNSKGYKVMEEILNIELLQSLNR